jgi:hypothetical protein
MTLNLDGTRTDAFVVAFSGNVDIDRETTILENLRLGHTVTVTVDDGFGNAVNFDARVANRSWSVKKNEEIGDLVTHKISLKVA